MGCSLSEIKVKEDEQIKSEEKEKINQLDIVKEKEIIQKQEDVNKNEKENEKINQLDIVKEKEIIPKPEDANKNEKEDKINIFLGKETFNECLELAHKTYTENTIIYYKSVMSFRKKYNVYDDCIVIKTLKKEGLPYKSQFKYKPPTTIVGKNPYISYSISKAVINRVQRLSGKSTEICRAVKDESNDVFYDFQIEQESYEPFVVYYIHTSIFRAFLNATNKTIFIIPFIKNKVGNPDCKCELYFKLGDYHFYGPNVTPKNEIINKNNILRLIPEEDNKFIFRENDASFNFITTESAFQSSFYSPEEVNIIKEALNKITLKMGLKVIAIKETYNIKQKIVTIELIKTIIHLNDKISIINGKTNHFFKENKNIKLLKLASNHEQVKQNLQSLTPYYFKISYLLEENEIFATIKAVYEFTISNSKENRDMIQLDCYDLLEGGLYICKVNYDKNEYESVSLLRDKDGKFSKENYYYENYSKNNKINGKFNEIYLHKIEK